MQSVILPTNFRVAGSATNKGDSLVQATKAASDNNKKDDNAQGSSSQVVSSPTIKLVSSAPGPRVQPISVSSSNDKK